MVLDQRIDVVEPDGDAAACVERAEDLAATFDAYTAAETPWRLAAALDTAGPRPADPVEFAVWCAAVARPPPPLGSGFDVRPSLLEALDGVSRLVIAEHGLRRALAERQGDDVTAFGSRRACRVRPRGPPRSALVCLTKVRIAHYAPRSCE